MTRKRILRKLVVNEISLVPEGASPGARVMLYKAHRPERTSHRQRMQKILSTIDFSKLKTAPPRDPDESEEPEDEEENEQEQQPNDEQEEATLPGRLEQFVAALQTHNPALTRAEAVHFLLHTARGRNVAEHLASTTKGITPMTTRADEMREMRDFAKRAGGMNSIAKHIIAKGTTTLTEHEFTTLLQEHAKLQKAAGESDGAAFSRIFSAPESIDIRRAHAITKNTPAPMMSVEPVQVGGQDATDVNTDQSKAMLQLQALAEEQRKRSPELSPAQAFARVFENPEYASLANAAHRRPTPTTSYEFPR